MDSPVLSVSIVGAGCPATQWDALLQVCTAGWQKREEVQYASGTKLAGQRHSLEPGLVLSGPNTRLTANDGRTNVVRKASGTSQRLPRQRLGGCPE